MKYRHLNRSSAHRQALLRNLVTSLFTRETISTTWPKAKEAQRLAEKIITLGKKNTEATRARAQGMVYVCYFLLAAPIFPPSTMVLVVWGAAFRSPAVVRRPAYRMSPLESKTRSRQKKKRKE